MQNIVISTGAGISAESGVPTFRDIDGLWAKHDPNEVAHIGGWYNNPEKLLDFHNMLKREFDSIDPQPNAAHFALTKLQNEWNGKVTIITQNIDGLHIKSGSANVFEIHGTVNKKYCMECHHVMDYDQDIHASDECPKCFERQIFHVPSIRPKVVFFGEVPYDLDEIEELLQECNIFLAVGTSLQVRPASMFASVARRNGAETWLINKDKPEMTLDFERTIYGNASVEVPRWVDFMLSR